MARFVASHLEKAARLVALSLALCSAGCASVAARRPAAGDPFERFNRSVYLFNTKLDHAVLRPMARRARFPLSGFPEPFGACDARSACGNACKEYD